MTLSEAKREFEIRNYHWTISEFEKEVKTSFPELRSFKTGTGWLIFHLMQELDRENQLVLARAISKQWNQGIIKDLGEIITVREERLLNRFRALAIEPSNFEVEVRMRREAGEKIRFASKRKLRKAMVAKFIETFGPQCVKMQIGEEWDPLFYMRCCGWFIVTQLWFGRQQSLISCRHIIESEARIPDPSNPEFPGPAMTLTPAVARLVYQWECLMDTDVERACDAAINHCGYVFDALPKLLEGIEFDKIDTAATS